jgi:hypothetical protein
MKLNAAAQMKLDAVATVLWTVFQCERIADVTGHPPSPCYGEASRPVATALLK